MTNQQPTDELANRPQHQKPEGPSIGLTFIVALLALVGAAASIFHNIETNRTVRDEMRRTVETLRRTEIALEQFGLRVRPIGGSPSGTGRDPRAPNAQAQVYLDQAKMASALSELRVLQTALVMKRVEGDRPGFPEGREINSYADLGRLLEDYLPLKPESEAAYTFLSYANLPDGGYLLLAEARDSEGTFITVTEREIRPWPTISSDR